MSGYCYGQEQPVTPCPYCDTPCDADFCDVGVGLVQCGPYYCQQCGASEIGPHDAPRELTPAEKQCGWYGPDSAPGSSANVIGGKVVSHRAMQAAYHNEFEGNPVLLIPGAVEQWREDLRRPPARA